jgi:hypothetical protein
MEFNFLNTFLLLTTTYLFADWFINLKPKEVDLTNTVPLEEFRRTLWKESPELYTNFNHVFSKVIDHYPKGVHVLNKDSKDTFGICKNGYLIIHLDIVLKLLKINKVMLPINND